MLLPAMRPSGSKLYRLSCQVIVLLFLMQLCAGDA